MLPTFVNNSLPVLELRLKMPQLFKLVIGSSASNGSPSRC